MYSIQFILNTQSIRDTYNLKSEIVDFLLTRKYVKEFCSVTNFNDACKYCVGKVSIKPFTRRRLESDLNHFKRLTYTIERSKEKE